MFLYSRIVALSQVYEYVMNLFGGICDQNRFLDKISELEPFERNEIDFSISHIYDSVFYIKFPFLF